MNGLEAERIPDPATAGDFLRRFDEYSIKRIGEISCIFHSGLQYTTSDNTHYVNRFPFRKRHERRNQLEKIDFIPKFNIFAKVF